MLDLISIGIAQQLELTGAQFAGIKHMTRSRKPSAPDSEVAVKYAEGDFPLYSEWEQILEDPYNRKLYIIGPTSDPNSQYEISNFYCCDVPKMRWTNLTQSLTYRNPYDPFSAEERKPAKRPIPERLYPGIALLRIQDCSFAVLFGGLHKTSHYACAEIIVVDLEHKAWWNLPIEGSVSSRLGAAVVAIASKIYVFGGYRESDEGLQVCSSFCIAECLPEKRSWKWTVQDEPYPPLVPPGHVFGQACSVYKGLKILLTPARPTNSDAINFTRNTIFFYHTVSQMFQLATTDFTGSFPRNVSFYSLHVPSATLHPAQIRTKPQAALTHHNVTFIPDSVPKEGRSSEASDVPPPETIHHRVICDNCRNTIQGVRHKCLGCSDYDLCTPCISSEAVKAHNPSHEFFGITEPGWMIIRTAPEPRSQEHFRRPTTAAMPPLHLSSSAAAIVAESLVYICAWVPIPNTEKVTPKVWQLFLSPDERIEHRAFDLPGSDCNFLKCMTIDGGRLRLLGIAPAASATSTGKKPQDEGNVESRDNDDDPGEQTWNAYFDVDLLG